MWWSAGFQCPLISRVCICAISRSETTNCQEFVGIILMFPGSQLSMIILSVAIRIDLYTCDLVVLTLMLWISKFMNFYVAANVTDLVNSHKSALFGVPYVRVGMFPCSYFQR